MDMSDVIHRLTRKKALPRTGKVLDAVGGGTYPIYGAYAGSSEGGDATAIELREGVGIMIEKSRYAYRVSHADTSIAESVEAAKKQAISSVMLDGFGHVTALDTCEILAIEDLDLRYLRKDIDDTAHGNITFEKDIILAGLDSSIYSDRDANGFGHENGFRLFADGTMWLKDLRVKNDSMFAGSLSSPMFASGFPNGTGWMLAPYTRTNAAGINETRYKLEIDDIAVRGTLRVYEFIVSQLLGENDNRIFSAMRWTITTQTRAGSTSTRTGDVCTTRSGKVTSSWSSSSKAIPPLRTTTRW